MERPFFTKRKFLSFPLVQQHKKRAELLKELYLTLSPPLLTHYNEIQEWLKEKPLSLNREAISDRYHTHLKKANFHFLEHDLLPYIAEGDHDTPLKPLRTVTTYLDHLRSAHNVGSILRTAEAFQLGPVVFSPMTPFTDHPQVQKTSMGASTQVTAQQTETLASLPKPLIAIETAKQAIPYRSFLFPKTCTIILGNEEYGCSEHSLKSADTIISIPLRGRKNSLNVANAYAIIAAEITHQHNLLEMHHDGA